MPTSPVITSPLTSDSLTTMRPFTPNLKLVSSPWSSLGAYCKIWFVINDPFGGWVLKLRWIYRPFSSPLFSSLFSSIQFNSRGLYWHERLNNNIAKASVQTLGHNNNVTKTPTQHQDWFTLIYIYNNYIYSISCVCVSDSIIKSLHVWGPLANSWLGFKKLQISTCSKIYCQWPRVRWIMDILMSVH